MGQLSEMGRRLYAGTVRYWPVIFRSGLFFVIGFLPGIIGEIGDVLKKGQWPSGPQTLFAFLAGTLSGATALRAYFDGSAVRHSDELKKSDTQFLHRSHTP